MGVSAPMKKYWKDQLTKYKDQDPTAKLLAKTIFPRMLKELWDSLDGQRLLPKAFEKCGLCPIIPMKAMERIPSIDSTEEIASHIDRSLLKKLETSRFTKKKKPREKKVLSGDSYTATYDEETDEAPIVDEDPSVNEEDVDSKQGAHGDSRQESEESEVAGPSVQKSSTPLKAAKRNSYTSDYEDNDEESDESDESEYEDAHKVSEEESDEESFEIEPPKPAHIIKSSHRKSAGGKNIKDVWKVYNSHPENKGDKRENTAEGKAKEKKKENATKKSGSMNLVRGSLVVAVYEGEWFIAEVSNMSSIMH